MSTILKALRRLEQDKTRADRPLREQVTGPNGAYRGDIGLPPRRWPILLGGIGAGVFAGLAVLFLVSLRRDSVEAVPAETVPAAAAPAPAPAQAAPPQPAAAAPAFPRNAAAEPVAPDPGVPATAPFAAAAPEPEVAEDVVVVDQGIPRARPIAEALPSAEADSPKPGTERPLHRGRASAVPGRHLVPGGEADATAEPGPEPTQPAIEAPSPPAPVAPAPAVARVSRPSAGATQAAPPAQAVAPARGKPRAPAEVAPTAPEESDSPPKPAPAPRAAEPKRAAARPEPAAVRIPAFPAIRVERTTWHPIAERRVAVLDVPGEGSQSVHEGDPVAGTVVKRIEPSGVVFEHDGREVRRKIVVPAD